MTTPFGNKVLNSFTAGNPIPKINGVPLWEYINPEDRDPAIVAARKKALLDQGLDLSREDAFWLVDDLENLEGEQLTGALDRLERYEMQNPGEIDRYVAGKATAQFEQEYIDSTPHPSSRLSRAQKDAINARARISIDNPEAAKFIPFPESYDDLPTAQPGSHHAVVKMLEDQGVDTTSGLGNFGQVLNIARKLNGSNRQFMAMATLVYDMLDNAGIEVPDGYPVIRTQEDLGQMMFLLPIEEGKAKWTLVEPEEMRWADLGAVGDLEEIMATVGAVLSQITPAGKGATRVGRFFSRHPAIAEFVSEFSLRRFGTLLEYWLDSDATAEDLEQALEGEYFETGLNVAIGRSIGRMIDTARGIKSPRGIYVSRTQLGAESVEEAERMTAEIIEETADTVEALQKLTDRDFAVTRGAASDSLPELQIQDARKKRAKPRERDYLERVDHYNLQALQDANNNLATRNSTADPTSIDSYQAVNAPHASERAAVEGLGNDIKVNTWGTIEDDIAYMDVRFVDEAGADLPSSLKVRTGHLDLDPGITFRINKNDKTIQLTTAQAQAGREGQTPLLMERALEEIMKDDVLSGYTLMTDNQVSAAAGQLIRGLERLGFKFEPHPDIKARWDSGDGPPPGGFWHPNDTAPGANTPAFIVTKVPGHLLVHNSVKQASYEKLMFDTELERIAPDLPVMQRAAQDEKNVLQQMLGWSEQRQVGKATVLNPGNSGVQTTIRRIQNRRDQALTGAERNEANSLLMKAIYHEQDDEGVWWLRGLVDEELDAAQLMGAYDQVRKIAMETGDRDMVQLQQDIGNLLLRGKMNWEGAAMDGARANAIRDQWRRTREGQIELETAEAFIATTKLLKRDADGDFINTDLDSIGKILSNSQFSSHLRPLLGRRPSLIGPTTDAIHALYRKQVLETGNGWTRGKHRTFMNKYDTAMQSIFSPAELKEVKRWALDGRGLDNPFDKVRQKQIRRLAPMLEFEGVIDHTDIVGSLAKLPEAQQIKYLEGMKRHHPQNYEEIRSLALEQSRRRLDNEFFDTEFGKDHLKPARLLKQWVDSNETTLKLLHGDQYVTDLRTIQRAHQLDARKARIKGYAPDTQGDVIRVFRSLIGPLSRPQRQITAASYVWQRRLSKKALEVYSDPAKIRELAIGKKVPVRTRAGVALLSRLGLLSAFGIDGYFETAADVDQATYMRAMELLDQWDAEGPHANVESEQ